jgi:hypothetical protein
MPASSTAFLPSASLSSKSDFSCAALSSVPVAFASMSRLSNMLPMLSLASLPSITMTGTRASTCSSAPSVRLSVTTTRSRSSEPSVSMLGSPRVPMSFGVSSSGAALVHCP